MKGVAMTTKRGVSSSEMIVSNLRSGISKMQIGCPALTASCNRALAAPGEK
jgi:hypothetical protein